MSYIAMSYLYGYKDLQVEYRVVLAFLKEEDFFFREVP